MKILYDNTGRIRFAVYDADSFKTQVNINIPVNEFVIDEADDNTSVCFDIVRTLGKVDEQGEFKYIIQNDILLEKQGWVEYKDPEEINI